jgi:hypothetical protein
MSTGGRDRAGGIVGVHSHDPQEVTMSNRITRTLTLGVAVLGLAAAAAPQAALARHGADDPAAEACHGADDRAPHVRRARGADDRAGHVRRGRGRDDAPGDDRGGPGADDAPNHG